VEKNCLSLAEDLVEAYQLCPRREGLKRVLCPKDSNWALTEAETGLQALASSMPLKMKCAP